ncbi:extracellular ribonuclease LE-like [Ipomoea triloba]|uniref:extracellular ribonuclease LE-like n=1 Tax=Ipomoea triloba TaxID=35885 RepID=UPI00125D07FB|nr:extracellular ribonuclease LE-like [Ipomoea triloba]
MKFILIGLVILQCTISIYAAHSHSFLYYAEQVVEEEESFVTAFAEEDAADLNSDLFYYYVEQWPGSSCDTKKGCCYPTTGKPATNFSIHGLWPTLLNGTWPEYCNPNTLHDESKISDLIERLQSEWPTISCPSSNGSKFWKHEWEKHGTCSILDQYAYFESTLNIKDRVNFLQVLENAGIKPDGNVYEVGAIKEAIKAGVGVSPVIECNADASKVSQLYQIYICVHPNGKDIIECPTTLKRNCNTTVEFPPF